MVHSLRLDLPRLQTEIQNVINIPSSVVTPIPEHSLKQNLFKLEAEVLAASRKLSLVVAPIPERVLKSNLSKLEAEVYDVNRKLSPEKTFRQLLDDFLCIPDYDGLLEKLKSRLTANIARIKCNLISQPPRATDFHRDNASAFHALQCLKDIREVLEGHKKVFIGAMMFWEDGEVKKAQACEEILRRTRGIVVGQWCALVGLGMVDVEHDMWVDGAVHIPELIHFAHSVDCGWGVCLDEECFEIRQR